MITVLKPRMSEKSYALSNTGVFVFDVDKDLNKHQIAEAVETVYGVTVIDVKTTTLKGKRKNLFRSRRVERGERSDVKKAYVTLKEGDSIPIFAAVEDAAPEEVADKKVKKGSKEK